jgi:uracil phosphoribosyltransferase
MAKGQTKSAPLPPNIVIHDHALIRHKIAMMRDAGCQPAMFRALTKEIGAFLAFEATRNIKLVPKPTEFYIGGEGETHVLEDRNAVVVAILRAGLVLADGALTALPSAFVGHMGFRRRDDDYGVEPHLIVLPGPQDRDFLVCDASIGTANTMCAAIELLKENGADLARIQVLTVLIAPEGAARLGAQFPSIRVHAAGLEQGIDKNNHIFPGLGDADERLFGVKP